MSSPQTTVGSMRKLLAVTATVVAVAVLTGVGLAAAGLGGGRDRTLVEDDANAAVDGYHDLLVALRSATIGVLEKLTRVETFGDNPANGLNDVHWVKALVDPSSRDVFAFEAEIVPADRTVVPAP